MCHLPGVKRYCACRGATEARLNSRRTSAESREATNTAGVIIIAVIFEHMPIDVVVATTNSDCFGFERAGNQ